MIRTIYVLSSGIQNYPCVEKTDTSTYGPFTGRKVVQLILRHSCKTTFIQEKFASYQLPEPKRMRFGIEHPVIQTNQLRLTKDQIEILQCLRSPKTLHAI